MLLTILARLNLELATESSRCANVNPGPDADPIFICYRGGHGSIYGHASRTSLSVSLSLSRVERLSLTSYLLHKACRRKGLLRVELKQGKQLKAADLGGTSVCWLSLVLRTVYSLLTFSLALSLALSVGLGWSRTRIAWSTLLGARTKSTRPRSRTRRLRPSGTRSSH